MMVMSAAQHNDLSSPRVFAVLARFGISPSSLLSVALDATRDVHHDQAYQWTDLACCILFATAGH